MRRRHTVLGLIVAAVLGLVVAVAGCGGDAGADIPEPSGVPQQTRQVSVFFSTGRTLLQEYRIIDANGDIYRETLGELLAAQPQDNSTVAVVQPEAKILGLTLEDGVVTVDWSKEVLDFEAEDKEKVLALAAVLQTLGQFPEVEKVRFTVEGKTEGSLNGKDISSFWGRVSLIGQPWDALRLQEAPAGGTESTSTTSPSGSSTPAGGSTGSTAE